MPQSGPSPEQEDAGLGGWYLRGRHRFVARMAIRCLGGSASASGTILDAGCGTGGLSATLAGLGHRPACCDANPGSIERGTSEGRVADGIAADVCSLPFADNTFDVVVCSDVLEHVPDDLQALKELLRVAGTGVLLTVPAHTYLWTDSDDILRHRRRYSRSELAELATGSGGTAGRVMALGLLPGLFLLAYKLPGLFRAKKPTAGADKPPLGLRWSLPRPVDKLLYFLFLAELALSRLGLIPWGHAWWMWVPKKP